MQPSPHVVRRGDGIPLLFVHGNGLDHRLLLDLDDVFAGSGAWERVYLDLPGFGRTRALGGVGGLPELADWLDAAVSELLGGLPFAVVGNSLGGLLVRDLVARRLEQVLGFALLAPVVDPNKANRRRPSRQILRTDDALLASLEPTHAEMYAEMAVVQSTATWHRFRDAALPGALAADSEAVDRLGERYFLPELPDDRLAGFDRPVLIVAGRQDQVVGYQDQADLADRFPRATYAVLDAAGHNVHLDQPDSVRVMLGTWAAQVAHGAATD